MPAFSMAQQLGEVISMKQYLKYGILPLTAWVICLVAEIINMKGSAFPQTQVEILSNIAMLATAIFGFFYLGLPAKLDGSCNLYGVLCNLTVSGVAFVMNVAVYRYSIRWDHLWEDLFCWHICWILCLLIQMLLLTKLGTFFLEKCQGLLSSAKQCGKGALQSVKKAAQSFMSVARSINKDVLVTWCVGLVAWGVYLGIRVYDKGIVLTFSDVSVIGESVWLWLEIIVICGLLRLLPSAFHKSSQIIQAADHKKVLFGIGCISLGVLLRIWQFPTWAAVLIPLILGTSIAMTTVRRAHDPNAASALTGTIYLIKKGFRGKRSGLRRWKRIASQRKKTNQMRKRSTHIKAPTGARGIDPILPAFMCCLLLPFIVLFILTLLSSNGRMIIEDLGWSNANILLELLNAMGQTATDILNPKP